MATAVVEERELLKTISWFDGFVVALANPSFLITALGGSALSLGGWGAVILWTTSVLLGESGLALALDRDRLSDLRGVLTPAAAMGDALLARFRKAGVSLDTTRLT